MNSRILTALFLIMTACAAAAEGTQPANFDHEEDKRRMDKLIEFPEIKGNIAVVLSCFSQIQANGKMESTGCFLQNNHDETFVAAVNKAAQKARMNPAIIDGKARKIFLQFRVEFIAQEEQKRIHFYLNPGYEENVKAYGFEHIAGQRVIGKDEPWNSACPQRAKYNVWVRAYLGEDGRADSPTVEHANGIIPTAACQDAIKQTIIESRYTPTLADGEPVPSTYIEIFGN